MVKLFICNNTSTYETITSREGIEFNALFLMNKNKFGSNGANDERGYNW